MGKTFKDKIPQNTTQNPTLQFISPPDPVEDPRRPIEEDSHNSEEAQENSTPRRAHQARRALPQYDEETKSRRLQLLLTPSLHEAVKVRAAEERMSVNEYINSVLRDATSRK